MPHTDVGTFLQELSDRGVPPEQFADEINRHYYAEAGLAPPPATGPPSVSPEPSAGTLSAIAIIERTLAEFGLSSLARQAWNLYLKYGSFDRVMEDIRTSPEYNARFPYMQALRKKGRAITEAQAIETERSYIQIMRSFGLPRGFYDQPDDFRAMIEGEVAPTELRDRVAMAADLVMRLPSDVRTNFERFYGIGASGLIAYYIDPNRAQPLLEQQFMSAQLASSAGRARFALTRPEAETLTARGITPEVAEDRFGQLFEARELLQQLPGERERAPSREEQINLVLGDPAAAENLRRRGERRRARFEAGGQFTTTRGGITGLSGRRT